MNMFSFFSNSSSQKMHSSGGRTTVNVNGKTTTVRGDNVNVINGKIYVDGKEHKVEGKTIDIDTVIVEGNCQKLDCLSAEIRGNVEGDVDCTSATIGGDVHGDLDGTNITCRDIKGKVDGLNISCKSMK